MHIDGGRDSVISQCLAHHWTDREIWNVVIVHDIEVYNVGAGSEDIVYLLAESSKVRG